jgi:ribose 5-phosphate isomerase
MGRRTSLYLRVFLCALSIVFLSLVTIGYKETCSNLAHAQNLSQDQYVTDDNPGILKAKEVQGRYSEELMSIPGVVVTGLACPLRESLKLEFL